MASGEGAGASTGFRAGALPVIYLDAAGRAAGNARESAGRREHPALSSSIVEQRLGEQRDRFPRVLAGQRDNCGTAR